MFLALALTIPAVTVDAKLNGLPTANTQEPTFTPSLFAKGKKFRLDSKAPAAPLQDFMYTETRFTRVVKDNAELGASLLAQAQEELNTKWERLELFKEM